MPMTFRRMPACISLATATVLALSVGAALASVAPPRGKVVALDKRTGRAAWETPLWSRPDAAVPPLVTPELVYVLAEGKTLKALDAATGRLRWQAPIATTLPLTLAGEVVIAVGDGRVCAFNRWNGKSVWEFSPTRYGEWKFDAHTHPVVAPGRLLVPAGETLIALDIATGQPTWAYTVTAATAPLQPVVLDGMVYIRPGHEENEVRLKLEDGLPDTGEYAMPPELARAIARQREARPKAPPVSRPVNARGKMPFIVVRAAVTPGGTALAAAGAKRWRFPAPPGWTIGRVAGESASHLFALLEGAAPAAGSGKNTTR